jgi:2-keto-4-pentenoate hydratase
MNVESIIDRAFHSDNKTDLALAEFYRKNFKLALAPAPGMDETALMACIDWVGHGFEIVQSIFPGWKFSAPDAVAAFALHGALLIGPRHSIAACAEDWSRML